MADYQYVTDGRDDGAMIGSAAAEKIGFHGTTPVVQQTVTQAATMTVSSAVTTCAQAIAELYTALAAYGLIST